MNAPLKEQVGKQDSIAGEYASLQKPVPLGSNECCRVLLNGSGLTLRILKTWKMVRLRPHGVACGRKTGVSFPQLKLAPQAEPIGSFKQYEGMTIVVGDPL